MLTKQIILGDNAQILGTLPSAFAELIYIDPPFNSGRTQHVPLPETVSAVCQVHALSCQAMSCFAAGGCESVPILRRSRRRAE